MYRNFFNNFILFFGIISSDVGAEDAAAFSSKFFRQIWANLSKIWANLGKIWANLDKLVKSG